MQFWWQGSETLSKNWPGPWSELGGAGQQRETVDRVLERHTYRSWEVEGATFESRCRDKVKNLGSSRILSFVVERGSPRNVFHQPCEHHQI